VLYVHIFILQALISFVFTGADLVLVDALMQAQSYTGADVVLGGTYLAPRLASFMQALI
jgi:hypothetical protein